MTASAYSVNASPRFIWRPLLLTLILHGALLALLVVELPFAAREVVRVKPVPKVINARLVDVSALQRKPQPRPKATVRPQRERSKPVVKKPAPAKPKVVSKPRVSSPPQPKAEPEPIKPPVKAEPKSVSNADALVAMAQRELAESMVAERALTADEMAASYAALIRDTVVGYWSRPPSARNGMQALLAIQLIPTGEVVSVQILESSGNTAFDRSAVNAVQKAGAFPELQKLPSRDFEKTFRRFRLLFKPEDLRY